MDWKLELVVVPVADQDVAKAFYLDTLGFGLIVDHRAGPDFRVIQASPPGSACAVALMQQSRCRRLRPGSPPGGQRHRPGPGRTGSSAAAHRSR